MSKFFDDLEAQMRAAARARSNPGEPSPAAPRNTGPSWLRRSFRSAPVLASLATTVAIVIGALLLLGHRTPTPSHSPARPSPGGLAATIRSTPAAQLRRESAYIRLATQPLLNSRVCQVRARRGLFIHGSPGRVLLSTLGVLRRAAKPSDRLSSQSLAGVSDVYAGASRRALKSGQTSYYIVPTRKDLSTELPSSRCFAQQAAALSRYLPKIPARLRNPTRVLQAQFISYDRALVARGPRDTFCLVTVARNSGGSSCGETAAAVRSGASFENDQGTYVGVVPTGVASVMLSVSSSGRAFTARATVHGNVFVARVGSAAAGAQQPTVTWRSAQGRVLKRITPPSRAQAAAFCKRHPVTCAAVSGGTSEASSSSSSGTVAAPAPPRSSNSSSSSSAG
jgi:hypothetical protein